LTADTGKMATVDSPAAKKTWQELKAAKKAEQDSRIPQEWKLEEKHLAGAEGTVDLRDVAKYGILSDLELEITGELYDATSLAAAIAAGKYTAVQVVTAFCKRAAIGHQLCNFLTEVMFADATKRAAELDEAFQNTGKVVGPLHGVPITFKECFHFKGYDSTNGYMARVFQPANQTSPLAELLQTAGAVVISKTNVPQTMLVAESENNVFGRSLNPVNRHLTTGGSSGGEGATQAFRGSALGIGTDVGGSIRIPAAANGVYGYKPTFGVIPMIGFSLSGWSGSNTGVPAVTGPLGHSVRDLALFTRVVRDTEPWRIDPTVIPNIMEVTTSSRKPVVGVIYKSGLTPHPPVLRALKEAVSALTDAGFEVRKFTPPDFLGIRTVSEQLFTLDGLSYQKQELAKTGEPVVSSVLNIGFWDIPRKTQEEAWAWNTKKLVIQKQMLDEWQRVGCDVVLSPAGPHTAVKPGDWTSDIYTVAWNVVDVSVSISNPSGCQRSVLTDGNKYPAVIIPFSHVDPEKDLRDAEFKPMNEADSGNQAKCESQQIATVIGRS
jgi:amidase